MKRSKSRIIAGSKGEINPDEIFLDSTNLPAFDKQQFEGRIVKPISKSVAVMAGALFIFIIAVFLSRVFYLEVIRGQDYFIRSEQNYLRYGAIFPERGIITDRNGVVLAENAISSSTEFSLRTYIDKPGFSHVLGYVKYPSKDSTGFYYKVDTAGVEGAEKRFDDSLRGENGTRIIEVNARGQIESRSVIAPATNGSKVTLSIDARLQERLYELIRATANQVNFFAGAGVMMDVETGEIIALASYPEYSSQLLTDGGDAKAINALLQSDRKPFLNRAVNGLYTPGSIVKPFVAMGALNEGIISETKKIVSTGSISIPNPFDPTKRSVFNDWKAHGAVDMREAIAVSSDVYFYEIGGGFEDQIGLGIGRIEKYLRMFGYGIPINDSFLGMKAGTIPNPEWKKENFDGEIWRIGDTYNTSIGQYGVQTTPVQAVRAVAALANDGLLITPTLTRSETPEVVARIDLPKRYFTIAKEGMRLGVTFGTARGLDIPQVEVAAKTGTAELGVSKQYVNSWITGFFPYEKPRYAFAIVMERGGRDNTIGALYVARQMIEWMAENTPEYLATK